MKKIIAVILLLPVVCRAQNGCTTYPMPTGYTTSQLQFKNALVVDNNGNKWVGFRNIGVGKFDGSNWTMYDNSNSPLPSNQVQALAIDPANNIWVGTDNGLAKFDGTNWTIFNTGNSGIIGNDILSLGVFNGLWIGTRSGFSKYNGSVFTNYAVSNSGLAGDTVQCFAFEPSGNAWIGTSHRLSKLVGTTWTTYSTSNSGLTDNNILSLYYQTGGNVWIGTHFAGLFKFYQGNISPAGNFYPSVKSFFPNVVYSISKGPQGGIIFNGISCFIELISTKPVMYYMPAGTMSGGICYFAADNASQKVWFVNRTGSTASKLYCFDYLNYKGLGLGLTYDNFKYLNVNQVSAPVLTQGDMFWDLASSGYEVPKGSGAHSIFTEAFWIGGIDQGGTLHQSAMTYRQTGYDYWPGPLDTTNGTVDSVTANDYDRVWKVDRFKVQEFIYNFNNGNVQNGSYYPDEDFITWPAQGNGNHTRKLAPFVDVNGNGIYDPMVGGDYPDIKGDQMLWWVFNDALAPQTETGGTPMGLEIRGSAYAFTCSSLPDSMKTMEYSTLYQYTVINRSANNYDSVHIGLWQDPDLGLYSDDLVGCIPQNNFGFVYNGDSIDGPGPGSYGLRPPVSSQVILDGPLAYPNDGRDNDNDGIIDEPGEKNLMTSFVYYNNDFTSNGNPSGDTACYNYSSGLTMGGGRRLDCNGNTTYFDFAGDPSVSTSCAEVNINNIPGDRRFLMGCGPFRLDAGDTARISFAIVYSRDTNLNYAGPAYFLLMKDDVRRMKNWYSANNFPSCLPLNVGMQETENENTFLVYPNPSQDILNIDYLQTNSTASYEIYDITGKRVLSGRLVHFGKNCFSVKDLGSGLYFIRIADGEKLLSKKFVKE